VGSELGEVAIAHVTAEPCIETRDATCVAACPLDCIHSKKSTTYDDGRPVFAEVPQFYIDRVECIDCGACVPVHSVSAIFATDDLPEKWKHCAEMNASNAQGGKFVTDKYPKHAVHYEFLEDRTPVLSRRIKHETQ